MWLQQFSNIERILANQTVSNERLVSALSLNIAEKCPVMPDERRTDSAVRTRDCATTEDNAAVTYSSHITSQCRRGRGRTRVHQESEADHQKYRTFFDFLRYLGVRGFLWLSHSTDHSSTIASIRISARLPGCLWPNKHAEFNIVSERLNNSWSDIAIRSSRIRIRNRIQEDSAIYQSLKDGQLEAFKFLMERGEVDINDVNCEGDSLLHKAIRELKWHFYKTKESNQLDSDPPPRCACRFRCLVDQASCPYWAMIQYLIDKGIDLNSENDLGRTPMIELIKIAFYFPFDSNAFHELGFKLLKLGALVDGESDDATGYRFSIGWSWSPPGLLTFAQSATLTGDLSVVVPNFYSMSSKRFGCIASDELVKKAVSKGKNVLIPDADNHLPIHHAISTSNFSGFRELLRLGLESNDSSYYSQFLLAWALQGICCPDCCRGDSCGYSWEHGPSSYGHQWRPILQTLADTSMDAQIIANECKRREGCGGIDCRDKEKKIGLGNLSPVCTRQLIATLIDGYKSRSITVPVPFQELYEQTVELYILPVECRRMGILKKWPSTDHGTRMYRSISHVASEYPYSGSADFGFASQLEPETPRFDSELKVEVNLNQSRIMPGAFPEN